MPRPSRDALVFSGLSFVLVLGLAIWAFFERDRVVPDADLLDRLDEPQPPIGAPIGPDDPRAAPIAAALPGRPFELVVLFQRAGVDVLGVVVPGAEAEAIHAELARAADATHLVPVILGPGRSVEALTARARLTRTTPAAILERARALELPPLTAAGEAPPDRPAAAPERLSAVRTGPLGLPYPSVAIGLFEADEVGPAAALAWLDYGNWRGCPDAATQVAVVALLAREAHATLVAITDDTLELEVPAPVEPSRRLAIATLLLAHAPSLAHREDGTERSAADVASEVVPRRFWDLRWPHR